VSLNADRNRGAQAYGNTRIYIRIGPTPFGYSWAAGIGGQFPALSLLFPVRNHYRKIGKPLILIEKHPVPPGLIRYYSELSL